MKTKRKLRQRRLALDFATPANPVDHDRGRALLAQIAAQLSKPDELVVRQQE